MEKAIFGLFPCTNEVLAPDQMSPILAVDMFPRTRKKSDINSEQSGHVETVVLLSKLKSTHHIDVEITMDEMDLTKFESKANTYGQCNVSEWTEIIVE